MVVHQKIRLVACINAEILSTGRELLIGKTVNTNASWLASRLTSSGIDVTRITAVGDKIAEISGALSESLKRRPSIIIITGGLGPTYDDLTLDGVASALRVPLDLNGDALDQVEKKYRSLGLPLTGERIKMAFLPAGSQPIRNDLGTAPGVVMDWMGTLIFCLPGVPREMVAMYDSYVSKAIGACAPSFHERSFVIKGIPESALAPVIEKWHRANMGIYIKSHPSGSESRPEIEIHLSTVHGGASPDRDLAEAEKSFRALLSELKVDTADGGKRK